MIYYIYISIALIFVMLSVNLYIYYQQYTARYVGKEEDFTEHMSITKLLYCQYLDYEYNPLSISITVIIMYFLLAPLVFLLHLLLWYLYYFYATDEIGIIVKIFRKIHKHYNPENYI